MVIFPAHILTMAMRRSSWGTVETGGCEWGERWEAQRDVQRDVFQKQEGLEEGGRVESWRRRRGRGDKKKKGMKREGDIGENLLHPALHLIPSSWGKERDAARSSVPSAERNAWGTEPPVKRQKFRWTETKGQVVTVEVTSSFEAESRQANKQQTEQRGTCKHPSTPVK